MEVVKRNMFSIASGVVALLAVVLAYYPFSGWFDELNAKLKQSSTLHSSIEGMIRQPHAIPPLSLEETEPKALDHFPNPKNIEEGKALVGELKQQSGKLTEYVMRWNAHQPLLPGVFPNGATGSSRASFKYSYYRKLDQFKQMLNATYPPTAADVTAEVDKYKAELLEKRLVTVDGRDNRSEIEAMTNLKRATMPEEICRQRARDFNMYVTAKVMDPCKDGYMPARDDQSMPELEHMWAAQLCLWIQEDVVNAIVETNKKAKGSGVENALVKRLLKLDISKKYMTSKGETAFCVPRFFGGGSGGSNFGRWDPAAMAAGAGSDQSEPDGPSARIYVASATGRVSNTLYDVVHFTVVVDCDASQFREFMANLVKDRFITILRTDFIGIDRDKEIGKGILYGQTPVLRVAMRCEAIFFREWTKKLMPPNVRKILKVPDDAPAGN